MSTWNELKTLFWLQWRLTRSMFRRRRASDTLRVLGLFYQALVFLFTLPFFLVMGAGLAVVLILLSPAAAYEVTMVVNTLMFLVWLLLPASYNSQIVERFEMSRLFVHPIRFRSLVLGSTLVSMLSMTGLWTLPILVGEVVGLAWHRPLALPLLLVGALPLLALLVLTGRIVEDFFDLVAGDRRLRALVLALFSLPFMVCSFSQYIVQQATANYSRLPRFLQLPVLEEISRLPEPESFGEFISFASQVIELLAPSRFLVWLPPGWATAGMGLWVLGRDVALYGTDVALGGTDVALQRLYWLRGAGALLLSLAATGIALALHASVTRRLMDGAALRVGAERVRRQRWQWRLLGPSIGTKASSSLSALLYKDWAYLWRSPMPRRLLFSSLAMAVVVAVPLRDLNQVDTLPQVRQAVPLLAFAFAATMVGVSINMVMAGNYFGTFDREGFATLALAPIDWRYVLLSANVMVLIYVLVQDAIILIAVAAMTRSWAMLPIGLILAFCLQVSALPLGNLAAIWTPYRTQLKFGSGRRQGNVWGLLAWLFSTPPTLVFILLPYVLARRWLTLTIPLAFLYSGTLYVLTLRPLARFLARREYQVWEAVTAQE